MTNLNIKSYKLLVFKENIRMRVIGLGWEDLGTHWSKNGKAFTPEELVYYHKIIVLKQRSCSIPKNPPVLFSAQKSLPQIVVQAPDIVATDADFLESSDEFDQKARLIVLER